SAPVTIAGAVTGSMAYTLRAIDADGFHWLRLSLPGQTEGAGIDLAPEERARLRLPEDFRRSLASVLTLGTTVVVTPDTLRSGNAGRKLTVITAGK
ncbi:MAG: L,D-transpeptidase, partial [Rhizorhabdus sp.]|nr:L,D-transpeptidase [Rhizorhabdus sp.]